MDIIKAIWLVIWCSRALYGQYGMKEIWGLSRMWYVEHSQNRLKSFFLRSLLWASLLHLYQIFWILNLSPCKYMEAF